ncbi:alpha/beta-hydrolase [Melanomma pulvis-pyrius CBS 109.77]|uniref:Alpha/beta-hydrolase n=1 Tax=Melanomma pulvis-pyrius CBS 109.77 TaxID=1314802 RepID=A0A6A6X3V5_9PLEO|nr:alpha/beta-hydrolase [Melanomma pulvis-pyrius CBS 109.77]
MHEDECITLPGGRTLSYAIYGSLSPHATVFYFHSYPSSRLEGRLWHSAASNLGIRLIVPDRPGMGNSTFQSNRTLLDWPNDVLALADNMKIQRFFAMGMSGGGPYALVCANAIAHERLVGVSVVSGLYPMSLGSAGMMMGARVLLWVAPWVPGLVGSLLDYAMGTAARNEDPKVFENLFMKEISSRPEVDQQVMRDEKNKSGVIEGTREGLRQGGQGAAWEAKLFGSDWGFQLEDIDAVVPVTLWHGTLDINSPVIMAFKAKKMVEGAKLKIQDGEGHYQLHIG